MKFNVGLSTNTFGFALILDWEDGQFGVLFGPCILMLQLAGD